MCQTVIIIVIWGIIINFSMIEVAAIYLDENLQKTKFERFMSHISTEKCERIRKYRKYEDALRTLVGDILVRYLLCKRLRITNQKLTFGVNEHGKPYLTNYNNIEYNISHSGEWVICTIDDLPIGIDIEKIKPIDMKISKRFFSNEEVKSFMNKKIVDREAYFYDLWTLKESYIKAVGKGLSIPLDSFTIRIRKGNITIYSAHEPINYYFKQYNIDMNYKMAVCSRKNQFPYEVDFIKLNKLYKRFSYYE